MFKYFILFFVSIGLWIPVRAQSSIELMAEQLAQAQLDAYNQRDLDAFLIPYAEDVKVFEFPDKLQYEGKLRMSEIYGRMFVRTPDLHCKLVHRMVLGNTVIDQELVTVNKNEPPMRAIAIYKVKDNKIAEVYFIYDRN